jgi:hypothetical protein
VAPLVVGLTGATFFTTAGGIALMTSLFGLTGGGLTGTKRNFHKFIVDIPHIEVALSSLPRLENA